MEIFTKYTTQPVCNEPSHVPLIAITTEQFVSFWKQNCDLFAEAEWIVFAHAEWISIQGTYILKTLGNQGWRISFLGGQQYSGVWCVVCGVKHYTLGPTLNHNLAQLGEDA